MNSSPAGKAPGPRSFAALNILAYLSAATVPLACVLQYGVGEINSLTAFVLYVPQHIFMVLPLLFFVLSLANGQRKAALTCALSLLLFSSTLLGWHWNWSALRPARASRADSTPVRVMSWNIQLGRGGTQNLVQAIREQNPDIVCLQETTGGSASQPDFTPDLLAAFPGWHSSRAREVTTLSRFPIKSERAHYMPAPGRRAMLENEIQTPQGPIVIFNAHISTSPATAFRDHKLGWTARIRRLVFRQGRAAWVRKQQLPVIEGAITGTRHPWILLGDFNNPPRGRFYNALRAHARDAFAERGQGTGFTFPAATPLIRIDYCWLGPGIQVLSCQSPRLPASDHRPVITEISRG